MNAHPITLATAARQDGFTIIEVLVAALVLTIGIVALVGSFDPARRLGTSAELHQVASARAEAELNRITSLPFEKIALKAAPTKNSGATKTDPTFYISGTSYQWDWNSSASLEALDIDTVNGDAAANPQTWTTTVSTSNGTTRVEGSTYRYITWINDTECTAAACGGAKDYKRATVAVTIPGMRAPVQLSAVVTNPEGEYDPITQEGVKCTNQGVTVPCIG